jgi:uncharacterized protein (DUF1015 family)
LATVKPFQPYRYSSQAGDPAKLLTQPYDKISPAMQAKYVAASPHNLVRVILGQRRDTDTPADNVYTRAAKYFEDWMKQGILAQDAAPGFYAYFQEFEVPDSGEKLTRKGFIGLGKVEDYEANIVFRHEKTLAGPKKDRLEVLTHTRAHFGQIFMLYPDRAGDVDRELDAAQSSKPVLDVVDDYGARHILYAITGPARIKRIQELMAPMKLLIADGHHRYETALNYRNLHPDDPAAQYVMMTFVNMYSPGLRILATHRVLSNLDSAAVDGLLSHAQSPWTSRPFASLADLKKELETPKPPSVRIGLVTSQQLSLLERPRKQDEMDVPVLHNEIIGGWLGISEEAVRDEKFIHYVRGIDAAVADVREKGAQIAFLLEPTPIDDMARIAFGGGVMPQKSTDFYPKLLTGVTIYKL